jgi:hypothetical protein
MPRKRNPDGHEMSNIRPARRRPLMLQASMAARKIVTDAGMPPGVISTTTAHSVIEQIGLTGAVECVFEMVRDILEFAREDSKLLSDLEKRVWKMEMDRVNTPPPIKEAEKNKACGPEEN